MLCRFPYCSSHRLCMLRAMRELSYTWLQLRFLKLVQVRLGQNPARLPATAALRQSGTSGHPASTLAGKVPLPFHLASGITTVAVDSSRAAGKVALQPPPLAARRLQLGAERAAVAAPARTVAGAAVGAPTLATSSALPARADCPSLGYCRTATHRSACYWCYCITSAAARTINS